jgi:type VI secretion system protein ImpH
MGREADSVAFGAALAAAPYRYDFYQALRRLECFADPHPRWGEARRPIEEPIRLGQEPELSFRAGTACVVRPGTPRPAAAAQSSGCSGCSVPTVRCRCT